MVLHALIHGHLGIGLLRSDARGQGEESERTQEEKT
jgi:hypothetical protein